MQKRICCSMLFHKPSQASHSCRPDYMRFHVVLWCLFRFCVSIWCSSCMLFKMGCTAWWIAIANHVNWDPKTIWRGIFPDVAFHVKVSICSDLTLLVARIMMPIRHPTLWCHSWLSFRIYQQKCRIRTCQKAIFACATPTKLFNGICAAWLSWRGLSKTSSTGPRMMMKIVPEFWFVSTNHMVCSSHLIKSDTVAADTILHCQRLHAEANLLLDVISQTQSGVTYV